jgi:hypothetical protein
MLWQRFPSSNSLSPLSRWKLVNQMPPGDVIVTERRDGASVFERVDSARLKEWLEDYTLGELWKMNVVGGRLAR